MLFPYIYVSHSMERMQEFINFIFYEVWCKAPNNGSFRLELFDENIELKELMESLYLGDTKGGDFFYGHVERIFGLFSALRPQQIDQLKQWYQANNDIENVCANSQECHFARYPDIEAIHPELSAQLASFFKGLYSKDLLGLAALSRVIGKIDDHYQEFMKINNTGKCPFCGISDMLGVYHTKREAYDHYLPQKLYPFNSINFRNLAPACHHCNSSYKTSKDPALIPKDPAGNSQRRKAFYPYATASHTVELTIDLDKSDIDRLTTNDIQLSYGPATITEEIETWRDVYGIDERYKAKCCSESGGKYWLTQVLDEWVLDGRPPIDYMNALSRTEARNPLADSNFLKKAFLEGCQRAGLLNNKQTSLG